MNSRAIIERVDRIEKLIREGRTSDRWLPLKEACGYTGLSESTIRRAIHAGRLKCSRQTGKLLFKLSWLDNFLMD